MARLCMAFQNFSHTKTNARWILNDTHTKNKLALKVTQFRPIQAHFFCVVCTNFFIYNKTKAGKTKSSSNLTNTVFKLNGELQWHVSLQISKYTQTDTHSTSLIPCECVCVLFCSYFIFRFFMYNILASIHKRSGIEIENKNRCLNAIDHIYQVEMSSFNNRFNFFSCSYTIMNLACLHDKTNDRLTLISRSRTSKLLETYRF